MDNTKKKNKGLGIKTRRFIANTVLWITCIICLFWFVLLIVITTRSHSQISTGFSLVPGGHLIENFKNLFTSRYNALAALRNSFIIATAVAALSTYFSCLTAYAIHAYDFKGKDFIFTFILMIMTIPAQVSTLGFVKMINDANLTNNFIPLIIPAIAAPSTFFYMKQYMQSSLPLSLIEAARIDGSGEFHTFNQIVLPLMKPAIAVQAIFAFVGSWNNYFVPALLIDEENMKTLPMLLAELRAADFTTLDYGMVYAMILFSILPVIVVYIFLSKSIVQGIALGSVKG